MAKKKAKRAAGTTRGKVSLGELERKLERLDKALLKAFNERAAAARDVAAARGREGQRELNLAAERKTLEQVTEHNKGPLSNEAVQAVFREVISGSRSLDRPLHVAYLGPKYSYSYLATIERFGESTQLAPVATISAVFEELNRGHADYGVVPLENSTDGRVTDTLDMFARLPIRICGEVQLQIRHNLLAMCPRDEIQEVYSKPQALSQCREWLAKHLPWAKTVEMTSTTAAAQLAAGKQGAAAIASRLAASNYGLDIVAENIQDNKHNVTRFAVIGGEQAARSGRDKTALMFEIPHRPGALADVMGIFKREKLNLTWIESFPLAGSKSEYLFFVEADGHQRDSKLSRALESLKRKTTRLEVLGSYAKSDPLE